MANRYLSVDEITNLLTGRTSDEVIDLLTDKQRKPKEIPLAPRNCLNCDTRFIPRHKGKLYCCDKCRVIARRKRRNLDQLVNLDYRTCEWCGRVLPETMRSHAKYCSTKCRQEAAGAELCVYCGEIATSKDHVIPRAFVKRVYDLGWHDKSRLLVVPACLECNSTAGAKVFSTLKEKRAYIHSRYKIRYAKLISMPDWTVSELEQLGPTLRSSVLHSIGTKRRIQSRLRWKS